MTDQKVVCSCHWSPLFPISNCSFLISVSFLNLSISHNLLLYSWKNQFGSHFNSLLEPPWAAKSLSLRCSCASWIYFNSLEPWARFYKPWCQVKHGMRPCYYVIILHGILSCLACLCVHLRSVEKYMRLHGPEALRPGHPLLSLWNIHVEALATYTMSPLSHIYLRTHTQQHGKTQKYPHRLRLAQTRHCFPKMSNVFMLIFGGL